MKRIIAVRGKAFAAEVKRTSTDHYVASVEGASYQADTIEEACDGLAEHLKGK